MRRLYLQIYLSFAAILLIFALLATVSWVLLAGDDRHRNRSRDVAALLEEILPAAEASPEAVRTVLERLGARFDADLALRRADRSLIASTGNPLPAPEPGRRRSGWIHGAGGRSLAVQLQDGRWLVARHPRDGGRRHGLAWLALPLILAVAVAIGAYPVVRRITRRLERLQRQVDDFGSGDLSARVEVEGRDEVADLARGFNRAADQIESLLDAKRSLLASASHELRTPLARIRLAIELLGEDARPDLRAQLAQDIAELDELIGELLLASRLDTIDPRLHFESIDLLALVAEEAAHSEANVEGEATEIRGDRRMLRRLVRNLIENAGRYGGGSIDVRLERLGEAGARLSICDRGPGVAVEDRESIFEPFYRPRGANDAGDRGVGLGLSLVRQIARHHRGEVSHQSRAGGGSCFEVTLWA